MSDIGQGLAAALGLLVSADPEPRGIVLLSLRVSLTAAVIAFLAGAPLGAVLAVARFRGRRPMIVLANALLGLPPVVVGLVVYMLMSRSGPLGAAGLLFTPAAMVTAQVVLCLPIVVALSHRSVEVLWAEYGDALQLDGAGVARAAIELLRAGRMAAATTFLAAFGRAIAEVGAILVVGGNIRGHTRTMTTAIALETSKGDLPLALALGLVLVLISVGVSAAAFSLARALPGR